MKILLEFEIKAIVEPNEQQKAQGIKNLISFYSEELVSGLKQVNVVTVKSLVAIDQKLLNKLILAEVQQTIINGENKFAKPKVYFKLINFKAL
jgi:hypothetical protein